MSTAVGSLLGNTPNKTNEGVSEGVIFSPLRMESNAPSNSGAVSSETAPLWSGAPTINDFEIIKPISRGAFGKVFLGRRKAARQANNVNHNMNCKSESEIKCKQKDSQKYEKILYAIKVMKKSEMIQKNMVSQVIAERNALALNRSPFCVNLFYCLQSANNVFLVMEYLIGGDLKSLLSSYGYFDEATSRFYAAEIALALTYLHKHDIIHRDIKPDNILLTAKGHIKLTDFGLSEVGIDRELQIADLVSNTPHIKGVAKASRLTRTPGQILSLTTHLSFVKEGKRRPAFGYSMKGRRLLEQSSADSTLAASSIGSSVCTARALSDGGESGITLTGSNFDHSPISGTIHTGGVETGHISRNKRRGNHSSHSHSLGHSPELQVRSISSMMNGCEISPGLDKSNSSESSATSSNSFGVPKAKESLILNSRASIEPESNKNTFGLIGNEQVKCRANHSADGSKVTSVETYEKKPMKRKRRHTTDMEDLLAEDEDQLISVKTNGRASCQIPSTSNNEQTLLESQSSILVGEFSKLGLQDKHRKRKRHCTRLGEALSDSEIEKNEIVGASRRNSSGTGDSNNLGRKSHKSRIVVRRRHNSSSSDGSILQNSSFIKPVIGESRNITNQCKLKESTGNASVDSVSESSVKKANRSQFSFDGDKSTSEISSRVNHYQFSTPLSCNSVFPTSNGAYYSIERAEPRTNYISTRRKTRNVHFMMAGGKLSCNDESPINLVDLDKSMDTSSASRYRQYSLPDETLNNEKLQRNTDCDMNCGGMMSPTKNPPKEQRIKSEYLIQGENNQDVVLSKNEGTPQVTNIMEQVHSSPETATKGSEINAVSENQMSPIPLANTPQVAMAPPHCSSTPFRTPRSVRRGRRENAIITPPASTTNHGEDRILGTPDYLAPELLLRKPHSAAVDWWGLGVCLYEFVTGVPPFSDDTPEKVFDNILALRLEWPSESDGDLPLSENVVEAIMSLLTLDPDQRADIEGLRKLPFFLQESGDKGATEKNDENWFANILHTDPAPFVPQPHNDTDTAYFDARNDMQQWKISQFIDNTE